MQTVGEYLEQWLEDYVRTTLRPSTWEGYRRIISHYIEPYIGRVPLQELTAPMVDRMFQKMLDEGLRPSTVSGAKRVLNVALDHARKNHVTERNVVRDTVTEFEKPGRTSRPYTPRQLKELAEGTAGTEWEMIVMLGGYYGLRRSEILGLRWRNVDLQHHMFGVVEQLPYHLPPKTLEISRMAPPKSAGRYLPITDITSPFFERQLHLQAAQRERAGKRKRRYYENDLVVARTNGAPLAANRVSSEFGKLLERLGMPHIRFQDLRHTAAHNMYKLTGDFYTVSGILGHTLNGIGVLLGLPMHSGENSGCCEEVQAERRKEVLEIYHRAIDMALGSVIDMAVDPVGDLPVDSGE